MSSDTGTDVVETLKQLGVRAMLKAAGHLPPDLPLEAKLIALDTLEMGVGFALEGVKALIEKLEAKRVEIEVSKEATVEVTIED